MSWAADALFCGPAIVARLRDQVTTLREVIQIDDVDLDKGPRQTPAAVVMFDRETLSSDADARRATKQLVTQRWTVFLAVRSARQQPGANSEAAGAHYAAVARALQGWTPAGAQRPFVRVSAGAANYGRDTSYYPLTFEIDLIAQ